jgi:uncharacterized protein YneF (UPF0154 family)
MDRGYRRYINMKYKVRKFKKFFDHLQYIYTLQNGVELNIPHGLWFHSIGTYYWVRKYTNRYKDNKPRLSKQGVKKLIKNELKNIYTEI